MARFSNVSSRLRRTTEFNSNRLLILSQKLHELVRFTVTRSAIGPEKTNRFENLVFGGKMDPKVRCGPIFSFSLIMWFWVFSMVKLRYSSPHLTSETGYQAEFICLLNELSLWYFYQKTVSPGFLFIWKDLEIWVAAAFWAQRTISLNSLLHSYPDRFLNQTIRF